MTALRILIIGSTWALLCGAPASALGPPLHVVEPDNYAEGTILDNVHPLVHLSNYWAYSGTSYPFGIDTFFVGKIDAIVNSDIFGGFFTSTGSKSFGRDGFSWISSSHPLAMAFAAPTSQVSIDFIGTSTLSAQVGVLEIYSPAGALLDTISSGQLFSHQVATLTLVRPGGDIGYARAYSSENFSPFGTFDNLRFAAVPEPSSCVLALLSATCAARMNRRRSRSSSGR